MTEAANRTSLKNSIEAVLFACGEPIPAERVANALGTDEQTVLELSAEMAAEYSSAGRGIRLKRMKNSLQLCSAPEFAGAVADAIEHRRPPRLSQPALESLAVVAYFQPVTRAFVEQVRGVDSSYTLGSLADKGLIEPAGKLEAPGRPSLFRTTDAFLRVMGISDLSELPELPDMSSADGAERLEKAMAAGNPAADDGGDSS